MKKPLRERPIVAVWNGEVFVPLPRFMKLCDQQFAVHEEIPLVRHEERSMRQHRGYFAAVREGWKNLAEEFNGRFPSPEHLRAQALVDAGFCNETDHICDSPQEARKLAAVMRRYSPYAIIKISGSIVKVFEPMSQSQRAMGKEKFEESCRAVMEVVASMSRSTPAELRKNAGRAA